MKDESVHDKNYNWRGFLRDAVGWFAGGTSVEIILLDIYPIIGNSGHLDI